jgi:hypothetical protein
MVKESKSKIPIGVLVQVVALVAITLLLIVLLANFPWSVPSSFRCYDTDNGVISLAWEKSDDVDGYILFNNGKIIEVDNIVTLVYNGETYWDIKTQPGDTYRLQIAAYKVVVGGIKLVGPKTQQLVVFATK